MEPYDLVGQDGNAFNLMGYTKEAMRDAYREARRNEDEVAMEEFGSEAQKALLDDAMSEDYNHLLVVLDNMIAKVNDYLGLD